MRQEIDFDGTFTDSKIPFASIILHKQPSSSDCSLAAAIASLIDLLLVECYLFPFAVVEGQQLLQRHSSSHVNVSVKEAASASFHCLSFLS